MSYVFCRIPLRSPTTTTDQSTCTKLSMYERSMKKAFQLPLHLRLDEFTKGIITSLKGIDFQNLCKMSNNPTNEWLPLRFRPSTDRW